MLLFGGLSMVVSGVFANVPSDVRARLYTVLTATDVTRGMWLVNGAFLVILQDPPRPLTLFLPVRGLHFH